MIKSVVEFVSGWMAYSNEALYKPMIAACGVCKKCVQHCDCSPQIKAQYQVITNFYHCEQCERKV